MNYKRFVLNVVLCFWIANACAQSKYEIYNIKGIVEVISQTQKASKGIQLAEKDKINIGDKASVSILDKRNCKLYEYDKKGTYSVSQIIEFCTDEKNNITNRIISEIRNNILIR